MWNTLIVKLKKAGMCIKYSLLGEYSVKSNIVKFMLLKKW